LSIFTVELIQEKKSLGKIQAVVKKLSWKRGDHQKYYVFLSRSIERNWGFEKESEEVSNQGWIFEKIWRLFIKSSIHLQWIISIDVRHLKPVEILGYRYNTLKKSND